MTQTKDQEIIARLQAQVAKLVDDFSQLQHSQEALLAQNIVMQRRFKEAQKQIAELRTAQRSGARALKWAVPDLSQLQPSKR